MNNQSRCPQNQLPLSSQIWGDPQEQLFSKSSCWWLHFKRPPLNIQDKGSKGIFLALKLLLTVHHNLLPSIYFSRHWKIFQIRGNGIFCLVLESQDIQFFICWNCCPRGLFLTQQQNQQKRRWEANHRLEHWGIPAEQTSTETCLYLAQSASEENTQGHLQIGNTRPLKELRQSTSYTINNWIFASNLLGRKERK